MPTTVWTIGYSNRSLESFLGLLKEYAIDVLVDVRSFPTSKVKHFKRERMEKLLSEAGIEYVWLGRSLGGYRRGGYEAHMKTELFRRGIEDLLSLAEKKRVCICCVERNPRYCHRRFISSHLEACGAKVVHILEKGQLAFTE